jgi:delta 1-pyrroline-5-carboxylate dehydrogenase
MSFRDEDHAVELANATQFGLVAGVWTRDGARQFRMAKRVRSGQVFINNYGAGGGVELPFKSIIVTGSGGGIGEGIAKRLAAEGAQVIVNDINAALGEKVVADITRAGGTASFFAADVTKSADVKALVEAAVQRYGKLDVMVNNAGWTHRNRPMLEVSEDEFDKVLCHQRQKHLPLGHPCRACLRRQRAAAASSTLPPPPGCGPARA